MTTSRRGWNAAFGELARAFEPRGADPAHRPDAALLARFAATGDEPAFAALVGRHGPMVLATARAIVRSPDDAEDVFQATFLVLARRARSIRSADAVAGWLHRVARHAALRTATARRRREQFAGVLPPPAPVLPAEQAHLRAESARLLHDELDRLPAKYRAVLVLCDLESLTRDQAAAALGCPAGTVAGRLARARTLLRARLVRRGGDGDAWLDSQHTPGPVPPPWAAAAVRSSSRGLGAVGPGAWSASRIVRGMTLASVAKAVATTALVGGLVAALIGWRTRPAPPDPVDPPLVAAPALPPVAPPPAVPPPRPSDTEPAVFRGQVVDPAGSGVAGAKVYRVELGRVPALPPAPDALTDAAGRFEFASTRFTVASGVEDQVPYGTKQRGIRLLAVAAGFGPGFIRPERSGPLEVALTRDDGPLRGRVVDAVGRPVAGAQIRGIELLVPPLAAGANGGMAGWVARARAVRDLNEARAVLTGQLDAALGGPDLAAVVQMTPTTDAEGRFAVAGLGRDRALGAVISGPEVATQVVLLTTERLDAPVTVNAGLRRAEPGRGGFGAAVTVHGTDPTIEARPGRTVAGVVRDADSKQPLAGVTVRLDDSDSPLSPVYLIDTVTDAEGRYRLDGIRANSRPRVSARPAPDSPWLGLLRLFDVEGGAANGNPPVPLDFDLRRGVWASGRVTDAATGQPRKVEIKAFVTPTNPYAFADPSIQMLGPHTIIDPQGRPFTSGPDGRFRVLIYPGPGFIAAGTSLSSDAQGIGFEALSGVPRTSGGLPGFATLPEPLIPRYYGTIIGVDPPPGSDSLDVVLPIRAAKDRNGTVVDPDGRPVAAEVMAYNLRPFANSGGESGVEPTRGLFTVEHLVPGRLRRVLFRQDELKRIALLEIRAAEGPPLVATLRPWGTIRLRVDDRTGTDGDPYLTARPVAEGGDPLLDESDFTSQMNRSDFVSLAPDQYEIRALEPGLSYNIDYQRINGAPPRVIARDVRVGSGETLDLGTVRVEGSP